MIKVLLYRYRSPWQEGDKAVLEKIQRRAVSMISGLKGESYEEKLLELDFPSLEERRHEADMVQTFKIVKGIDRVEHGTWFHLATDGGRATRSADCPHNLRQMAARLEVRRNFFSNRVIDSWNQLPTHVKNVKTVSSFKNGYKKYTAGLVPPTWRRMRMVMWRRCGEDNCAQTLPERPQRGHWKYYHKNKNLT